MSKTPVESYLDEFGMKPDVTCDLRSIPKPSENTRDEGPEHRHVEIILDDGSSVWLDINTDLSNHDFIDIRWFNPDDKMKWIGAFTIVNGRRQSFGQTVTYEDELYREPPMRDAEGTPVTGAGWNSGYVVSLLVDKNGREKAAREPSPDNG